MRPEKTEAITAAFFNELADSGYERLTMDRVAARAGVGKAALYRRWPSKQQMLVELVDQFASAAALPPDTGTLRGDLLAIAEEATTVLANPLVRRVIRALIAEAQHSPELATVLSERFIVPRRRAGERMIARAVQRGEISPDPDLVIAMDSFGGPLYFRAVILGEKFPPDYPQRLTDAALRALDATTTPRR